MSQTALGVIAGVTNQQISLIEHGGGISDEALRKIAVYFKEDFGRDWLKPLVIGAAPQNGSGSDRVVELPILAKIAAGGFSDAEIQGETIEVPTWILPKNKECYAAYVQGDSMRDAGIFHLDRVILTETKEPHNHDIVVVETAEGATIKEWIRKSKSEVELRPRNSDYDKAGTCTPITVKRIAVKDIRRVHEVVAVIRVMK